MQDTIDMLTNCSFKIIFEKEKGDLTPSVSIKNYNASRAVMTTSLVELLLELAKHGYIENEDLEFICEQVEEKRNKKHSKSVTKMIDKEEITKKIDDLIEILEDMIKED